MNMKNKELFTLNPDDNNLINDGVVEINTAHDANGLKIIRHELKTFVCEGEYQKGFYRILDTYLKHLEQPKQPAVWVSGFFGSGKSHLVKMLGYLWDNFKFPNGETARTIKQMPADVMDLLTELDRKQNLHGRLTISGTLKDFPSTDIRYSFLQLFLSKLDLPQQLHLFNFIYWAKQENIYDEIKAIIESNGKDFKKEYENLFVSTPIAKAILQVRPSFAQDEGRVKEYLKMNFKRIDTINREQLISTIKDKALPLIFGEHLPCTAIILDEVQQFIGNDANKTIDIQNLAQDLCSNFEGKFLLIGTGQSALSETPYLQPLQDRFTVKISLSDTDVETVTRKTVLEKKATVIANLNKMLEDGLGEIAKNLSGTSFGYLTSDKSTLSADYPILPSARKLWKKILQVIDTAGTSGLLRSQLRIIDESVKHVANKTMGTIVPADFIFEQKQSQLIQNALLLNETNNLIQERKIKGGDSELEARILSVVFLIDLLPADLSGGGLKSDENTISDLLLEDITVASDGFRNKVKAGIKRLVDTKVLMSIDDEYKLQTKVGQEWEQEFTGHAVKLNNSGDDQIVRFRKEKLISFFKEKTRSTNILHGVSKIRRDFEVYSGSERPNTDTKLNVWIRDGWLENENFVLNEIRAEGLSSPLAYVYVKKSFDAELKSEIVKYIAADLTLQSKGIPSTPEGEQAKKSMETRKSATFTSVTELIEKICLEASVLLAGGNKVEKESIKESIEEALINIADRQFPEFRNKADYKDWDKAFTKAISGDPEALKKIGWGKETKDHPVAMEILRFIGNNTKTGKEIRSFFMKAPYGWSQDAIDTAIIMLRNYEYISTTETNLNQSRIGSAAFKKEVHTITAQEKIKLKKLYLDCGIQCKPGEEFVKSNTLIGNLRDLAIKASGLTPKPETINMDYLKEIENLDGNERLLIILQVEEKIRNDHFDWSKNAKLVSEREPDWQKLDKLMKLAPADTEYENIREQYEAILDYRLLLNEPDLVKPLLEKVVDALKAELNTLKQQYLDAQTASLKELNGNEYFQKLSQSERHSIFLKHQLTNPPVIEDMNADKLINELSHTSLDALRTKIIALPQMFAAATVDIIQTALPKAQSYSLPKKHLISEGELDTYLADLKNELSAIIKKHGSVILR